MTYKQHRIGEHCQVGDGAHGSLRRTDDGIPYLTAKDIKDGRIDTAGAYRIDEATFAKNFRRDSRALTLPLAGDVVFGIIGSLGQAYCVKAGDRFGLSSSIAMLRPNQAVLDSGYLYYWVTGPQFQGAIHAIKGGVAQSYISLEMIRSLPLLVPSLSRQREVVAVLSAYDHLIENNTRRIAILEEMARRIYEEWFVRFRFPGHEGVRMVESDLGLVPATWRVLPLSAVAEVVDCLHSKKPAEQKDGAGLMLQLFNIAEDGILDLTKRFRVSAKDYSLWTSRMEVSAGDCVITNVGRVGAVAQIPKGVKAALGRNMTGVRAKRDAISATYLLRYLLSSHMESEVVKKKDPGTIMDSLNVKGIVRLSVPVAHADTMQAFDRLSAPMRRQVEVLVLKNANLRETRDLLLPRLISGEVDVSAMPEPEALAA